MKKSIIKTLFIITIFISFIPMVSAKSLQDMYNELANLQKQYEENKNKKNLTENEINKLNNDIASITASIEKTREDIKKAEKDIEESKQKIEDKKVETDGLIQFLQVSNGGNIYLEYLFDAENYTDFIYRYEVVKQLTNYNSELIDDLEKLIIDLQNKEKELAAKQVNLEQERKDLTHKISTLTASLTNFKSEGIDIEGDIKDLQKVIKIYEDMGCKRNQDIDECTASVNAYGWSYPLPRGCVTSEYGWRSYWNNGRSVSDFHYGIDLSCISEGSPVNPVAAGKISRIIYRSSCGGNQVFIDHNVNGRAYTSSYLHLLRIADDVKVGKVVTENSVIGYVGGYSTSSSHGGYDGCTTGTHLHLGMAEGHNAYRFFAYSINPREIFSFPKLVYDGGGYFYR